MTAARWGRRTLSLRARLLIGLIALTAMFLVVMGVVSTVVLGRLEQNQFNAELRLAARQPVGQIAEGTDGFAAAYLSLRAGATGELTPGSPVAAELQALLNRVASEPAGRVLAYMGGLAASDEPFDLAPHGAPALRVAWRPVTVTLAAARVAPPGPAIVLVGRPVSDVGSHVRGLVLAELITGGVLLALLAVCGSWLIGRGLAPLDRMASTADMITRSGDLAARMPDAGGSRQETGRLAAAINTMLDRIQQAFSARLRSEHKVRQFAADASHELRTPLTTIRGYAELYRAGAIGPDELPNALRRIEQEADRMSSLVAELLELARLDRDSSLDLTETDLSALVADAVEDAQAVEPKRPVTARTPASLVVVADAVADAQAVEPRRPVSARTPKSLLVVADEPRIRQVLANLLGNVREHTSPDTPVSVRLSEAGQGALLEVTDSGQGMDSEAAARAFDRFYRGGHNGKDAHGSGLGLSIVQAIAVAHGGHAMLKSAAGVGTSVQVWIPSRPPAQDAERIRPPGAVYN